MKLLLLVICLVLFGCAGAPKASTIPNEKTDECEYADEVCREAESVQKDYEAADDEQKKDLVPVLNSYIEHCESARKACKKSMR